MLSRQFPAPVRERGQRYFREHRVRIRTGSSKTLEAEVRGSESYFVRLTCSENRIGMACECPFYFDRGLPCKHIWAAILAADEQGYLSEASAIELARAVVKPTVPPAWKMQLNRIALSAIPTQAEKIHWPAGMEIVYLVDIPKSRATGTVVLTIGRREPRNRGWNTPRTYLIDASRIAKVPLAEDREILALLMGAGAYDPVGYSIVNERGSNTFSLPGVIAQSLLPRIVRTGRCFLPFGKDDADKPALQWDDGEPWRFLIEVRGSATDGWRMEGWFRRGSDRMSIDAVVAETRDGFLITREHIAGLTEDGSFPWIRDFRNHGGIEISELEREEFFSGLLCSPALPALELPALWRYEEVTVAPRKCLRIFQPRFSYKKDGLRAELSFEYEGRAVDEHAAVRGIYHAGSRRFLRRDAAAEEAAAAELLALGLRFAKGDWSDEAGWRIVVNRIPRVVRELVEGGWQVSAEGRAYRQAGQFSVSVSSGVDWFELQGAAAFGETTVPLPQLLAALRRGESMVTLDDGSYGLLPEEWLRRLGVVAAMGETDGDSIRFRPSQAGVLDALLATMPAVDCDEAFRRVRRELATLSDDRGGAATGGVPRSAA